MKMDNRLEFSIDRKMVNKSKKELRRIRNSSSINKAQSHGIAVPTFSSELRQGTIQYEPFDTGRWRKHNVIIDYTRQENGKKSMMWRNSPASLAARTSQWKRKQILRRVQLKKSIQSLRHFLGFPEENKVLCWNSNEFEKKNQWLQIIPGHFLRSL